MTSVAVPLPVVRRRNQGHADTIDTSRLEHDLRRLVDGEVRFDAGSRSAYSTDASNYRQVPIGVVVPRTVDAAVAAVAVCRSHGAPLLSRGGGTSLAGECTNAAVVIDWSKRCNRLLSVDVERRRCVVEPGIVLDHLNDQLRETGLEFGPRPSTHSHCTIGGMIGNNSCGATAQRTGKVVDNVARLEVLLYDGTRMWVGPTPDDELDAIVVGDDRRAELYRQLRAVRDDTGDLIRRRYPAIPRRVSGYDLDSLLPEHGFDVAGLLVGSEGSLVTVLRAELKLVETVPARAMAIIGFPDIVAAAAAVPDILPSGPIALEAVDDKLISFQDEKHLNPRAVALLPDAGAWLLVQMGGQTQDEADLAASAMLERLGKDRDDPSVVFYDDERHERELWDVRESALGATARVPGQTDTWPGWEDSAVAPERLADYLQDLRSLLDEFGYGAASLYGHFGQGCVHTRIPFDLTSADGIAAFRSFVERAADLVARYGGSLSGEHGDGQARGELLATMFGPELVEAFGRVKAIFDPGNRMNPGKVVDPRPLDADLRLGVEYSHATTRTFFRYPDDQGSFGRAVLRCVGVGRCRREHGGVMCPSFQVTRDEEHSTRGRARLLFEMLDGSDRGGAIGDGWRSKAVLGALDLCLACKGCRSDCPVNVDMATYKAEFLAHHYRHRLRPASHYSMGWLPIWALLASPAPGLANAALGLPGLERLAARAAGVDGRRRIPRFAPASLQSWMRSRPVRRGHRGTVVLWPDTFTNRFRPGVGRAAVGLLEAAGWTVEVPSQPVCCGLTWISTGQLGVARRVLRRTVSVLRPHLRQGARVVGLEPSCTSVFRSDGPELLPDDEDVTRLRKQTSTLAELLVDHSPGWRPPTVDRDVLVQTHCHQHAILGTDADRELLDRTGARVEMLDSGCCGLAGNFGFEAGHYDVSMACAERVLLPSVRDASPDAVILADGFSCQTQISQGDAGGRRAVHLAELLVGAEDDPDPGPRPERRWAPRPD